MQLNFALKIYEMQGKIINEEREMMRKVVLVLLLSNFIGLSESVFWKRPRYMPISVFGRPFGGFLNHRLMQKYSKLAKMSYPNVKTDWITQKIDNFNPNDKREYKQRYMYNMEFYNNSGLAFIMIGGESTITEKWIGDVSYTWLVWARKHGAACFQLEHRYYGASQPFNDVSTASYRYFTIEQALADLRNFIIQMNKKHFSNFKRPRWVLFGGSYPGALAAWFRETNADITTAAISSSGVVQTRVDYWDYAENVQYVLRTVDPNCVNAVREGIVETFRNIYTITGRKMLSQVYNLCKPLPEKPTPKDIQYFLANIFYIFESITQYTGDNRDLARKKGLGVPNACKILTNNSESNSMKRIRNVISFYFSFYGRENQCLDVEYDSLMTWLGNTTLDKEDDYERVAARGWTWQCCTQLGFLQTTDNGESIFGSSIPLDFYVDQCMQLFGRQHNADSIREGADLVLRRYGGYNNYHGTRTVFANGSFDPWKSVCCQNCNNTANEVYSVMVIDGAHCVEMYPANKTDSESLKNVRAFIDQKLDTFIAQGLKDAANAIRKSILLLLLSSVNLYFVRF